jgi:hypothetical protein
MKLDNWLYRVTGFTLFDWVVIAGLIYAGWCLL